MWSFSWKIGSLIRCCWRDNPPFELLTKTLSFSSSLSNLDPLGAGILEPGAIVPGFQKAMYLVAKCLNRKFRALSWKFNNKFRNQDEKRVTQFFGFDSRCWLFGKEIRRKFDLSHTAERGLKYDLIYRTNTTTDNVRLLFIIDRSARFFGNAECKFRRVCIYLNQTLCSRRCQVCGWNSRKNIL